MHLHRATIRMHDTDAAGVVYFASMLRLAHEAYETAMEAAGLPLGPLLRDGRWALPIVHAEADYQAPLRVGDAVEVHVSLKSLASRSFTLAYSILLGGRKAAEAETVHAAVRRSTGRAAALPPAVKTALRRIGA